MPIAYLCRCYDPLGHSGPAPMARYIRTALLALLVSVVSGAHPVGAQSLTFSLFERYVDSLRQQSGIPGLSGAIVQDGRIVWERGFGMSDVERSVAARPTRPTTSAASPRRSPLLCCSSSASKPATRRLRIACRAGCRSSATRTPRCVMSSPTARRLVGSRTTPIGTRCSRARSRPALVAYRRPSG